MNKNIVNQIGKTKVSSNIPIMGFIASDWNQKLYTAPEGSPVRMISFGKSFAVTNRILKNSARNN
jgi:hypothetical protein